MTNTGWVLLVLAVVSWLALCSVLSAVIGQTATGDAAMGLAMQWIYAVVLVCVTWLCLWGVLLSSESLLPGLTKMAAVVICPLSGLAALAALYVLSEAPERWPAAVPMLVPVLIMSYVLALSRPSTRAIAASLPVSLVLWSAVLLLSLAIAPKALGKLDEKDKKRAERKQVQVRAETAEHDAKRQQSLAKVKTMTPQMRLTEWYDLLDPKNGVRAEALASLKQVDRRQGDAEELIAAELPFYMTLVPELDLKPTATLCAAARKYLAFVAKSKQYGGLDPSPYQADDYIDNSLEAVRWFQSHDCNCRDAVALIQATIRQRTLDSPDRQKILATLASLTD